MLIASVDAQERYRFNNRTYEEWVGRSRAEVTGKTLREVLGETFYGAIAANVAAVLAGESVTYEGKQSGPTARPASPVAPMSPSSARRARWRASPSWSRT